MDGRSQALWFAGASEGRAGRIRVGTVEKGTKNLLDTTRTRILDLFWSKVLWKRQIACQGIELKLIIEDKSSKGGGSQPDLIARN